MNKSLPLILMAVLAGCGAKKNTHDPVDIDVYTSNRINSIIETQVKTADQANTGEIIAKVSAEFLGTPYKANMLIGSSTEPEKLVIDFRGLDCFTYLDYVESLRKSKSKNDFIKQLVGVRYIDGDISYQHRKHFFTDWSSRPPLNAKDITAEISTHTLTVTKYLNQKSDGGEFIPTLGVFKRDVSYIPAEFINDSVIDKLRTGDYIGIYTNIAGLDVTHTGIFIMTKNGPVLRNASSLKVNEKVVDSSFIEYVKKTPGIIVLRAL
ncbi:DUF1460 domain-containing protein [Yersinia similis]|uniref:Putative lipoprotein n=1 Tax=Yersinia similis TaxID=367190 RepID=A0A0T9PJ87_9GAMM|nr:DUF1460 domain-containing protein [Yersinia similis]AHK21318.1 hypothetical protein BF17_20145 [Yersinia similis]CFQ53211.1 putative lipoprotein [Yersinia similis]CNB55313.1 putative lipoprotein [Yersinia similis]CNE48222.1 putative lipoprotein [Yersinia similis]CNE94579.1 putative lipoprotein [Yersinia similis]